MPKVMEAFLKRVVENKRDAQTTALGVVGAAVLASNIDYAKLFAKDPATVGTAIGVVVVALFGYFTNKSAAPKE